VLLDPAGHPFCLTTQIPLDVIRPQVPPVGTTPENDAG
jgi:hypothetical protein